MPILRRRIITSTCNPFPLKYLYYKLNNKEFFVLRHFKKLLRVRVFSWEGTKIKRGV
jgi:hypothetical protein